MTQVTLATYNIHKCVGLDRRWDPQRTFAVIEEMRPDILAIQEFDSRRRAGRGEIAPEAFATATGLPLVAQPTLSEGGRFHGNLLLSRHPVVSWRLLDLSVPSAEPRGAICARIDLAGHRMTVATTHLGLGLRARHMQLQRLLAALDAPEDEPIALLGDLNEWLPRGGAAGLLDRRFGASERPRSFPALWPLLALDTIRVAPASALSGLAAHRSPAARLASDHLPLLARLDLSRLKAPQRRRPGVPP